MINKHIRRCPMSLQDATSQPFGRKLQKISQQVTSVGEGVEKLDPVPMGSQNDGAGMVQYTTWKSSKWLDSCTSGHTCKEPNVGLNERSPCPWLLGLSCTMLQGWQQPSALSKYQMRCHSEGRLPRLWNLERYIFVVVYEPPNILQLVTVVQMD